MGKKPKPGASSGGRSWKRQRGVNSFNHAYNNKYIISRRAGFSDSKDRQVDPIIQLFGADGEVIGSNNSTAETDNDNKHIVTWPLAAENATAAANLTGDGFAGTLLYQDPGYQVVDRNNNNALLDGSKYLVKTENTLGEFETVGDRQKPTSVEMHYFLFNKDDEADVSDTPSLSDADKEKALHIAKRKLNFVDKFPPKIIFNDNNTIIQHPGTTFDINQLTATVTDEYWRTSDLSKKHDLFIVIGGIPSLVAEDTTLNMIKSFLSDASLPNSLYRYRLTVTDVYNHSGMSSQATKDITVSDTTPAQLEFVHTTDPVEIEVGSGFESFDMTSFSSINISERDMTSLFKLDQNFNTFPDSRPVVTNDNWSFGTMKTTLKKNSQEANAIASDNVGDVYEVTFTFTDIGENISTRRKIINIVKEPLHELWIGGGSEGPVDNRINDRASADIIFEYDGENGTMTLTRFVNSDSAKFNGFSFVMPQIDSTDDSAAATFTKFHEFINSHEDTHLANISTSNNVNGVVGKFQHPIFPQPNGIADAHMGGVSVDYTGTGGWPNVQWYVGQNGKEQGITSQGTGLGTKEMHLIMAYQPNPRDPVNGGGAAVSGNTGTHNLWYHKSAVKQVSSATSANSADSADRPASGNTDFDGQNDDNDFYNLPLNGTKDKAITDMGKNWKPSKTALLKFFGFEPNDDGTFHDNYTREDQDGNIVTRIPMSKWKSATSTGGIRANNGRGYIRIGPMMPPNGGYQGGSTEVSQSVEGIAIGGGAYLDNNVVTLTSDYESANPGQSAFTYSCANQHIVNALFIFKNIKE